MLRRTPRPKLEDAKAIPDEFIITSLEIIIHHDRKLGEGGSGQVYEGDWNGNRVAVKTLDKTVKQWAFEQEIDVWRRLHHPNILRFWGACSIADPPFMVCAFKANGDAVQYLHNNPNADRRKIVSVDILTPCG